MIHLQFTNDFCRFLLEEFKLNTLKNCYYIGYCASYPVGKIINKVWDQVVFLRWILSYYIHHIVALNAKSNQALRNRIFKSSVCAPLFWYYRTYLNRCATHSTVCHARFCNFVFRLPRFDFYASTCKSS